MTDSIRRVGEMDLFRITQVPRSTRSSWEKKGLVAKTEGKRFDERQAVETAIFSDLTDALDLRVAQAAWVDAADRVLSLVLEGPPGGHGRLDLLVNSATAAILLVKSDEEIGKIIGRTPRQSHTLVPVAGLVNDVRQAYWRYARLDTAAEKGQARSGRRTRKRSSA
jgi:hypothetical protein